MMASNASLKGKKKLALMKKAGEEVNFPTGSHTN